MCYDCINVIQQIDKLLIKILNKCQRNYPCLFSVKVSLLCNLWLKEPQLLDSLLLMCYNWMIYPFNSLFYQSLMVIFEFFVLKMMIYFYTGLPFCYYLLSYNCLASDWKHHSHYSNSSYYEYLSSWLAFPNS